MNGFSGNVDRYYLPDLSSGKTVFMLVLVSELFVLVQQLAMPEGLSWLNLALDSLFVQWIVLVCAAFTQIARRWLNTLSPRAAAGIVLLVVAVTTIFFTASAQMLILPDWPDWVRVLHNTSAAIITAAMLLRYFYIRHQLEIQRAVLQDARLDSLQARIRPHFLFNSMNIIASLIRIDPDKAEEAVEDLSDLFRSGLQKNETIIPIQQETELCKSYLRIEQLRLGDRLQTEWRTNKLPASLTIPSFTLQPLVENAVYHGIQPLEEGGKVQIFISVDKNKVQISVKNPMPLEGIISKGNQIALKNIRSRLSMLYGTEASLTTEDRTDQDVRVFIVRVTYPFGDEQ